MSRGRCVPPTRRPRWGPCLFPPLVTPHGCPPPVPQGRMPRWPQCPQLAAEAETGLRFHLLNGVIFPHLRGLCVTERSTLQIQRSECLREKDACLRRHRQEHRRKVLETLRPSASLSGQGRKEASDVRRQRCQGSSATARTRGMTFATFVSWCPPRALSTASVSQGHCHPAVPWCLHGPPEPQQGRPRWFPLRSLWEGLWPGGGEAGRGRQGMAARSRRKSSPRSEASDSAPRAGFWGRRGAHGGGTGRGQGRPQISPRPLWHTELRVSSAGRSCADPSLGEPRTLPASPPRLTTFSLLMNVCVRLNRPQGAPEAINCHYLGGRPLVG